MNSASIKSSHYIFPLSECSRELVHLVGGKNGNLGEMLKAGIRVPPGFAITTKAYENFLHESGTGETIAGWLQKLEAGAEPLETVGAAIRNAIRSVSMPAAVARAISAAYESLAAQAGDPCLPVAVRSSATAEDAEGASFAGQQDTYLWIRGASDVLNSVARCWASLFTDRAISYRQRMNWPHDRVSISVGVQKMVKARTAGVMFTLNPANGDRSSLAIDASWGLGESVVRGEVTPDNFLVNKVTMEITRRTVSSKGLAYEVDETTDCVQCRPLPAEKQDVPCVSDSELKHLARMGKVIEKYYGAPQDVEWAIEQNLPEADALMILQARPETVWSQRKREPVVRHRENPMDYILDNLLAGKRMNL